MSFLRLSSLLLLLLACAWGTRVQAQVHRCGLPDGTAVFTDRACAAIGAEERLTRNDASGVRPRHGGCAHNLRDLVFEITTAIDANDVNRLAGTYHWVGASSRSAIAVMDRLDAVAQRPLVDISPILAGTPDADPHAPPDLYPQIAARRPPVGLRVEQTFANGSTPSHTVFGLRRHLDCWWITL